MANIRIQPDGIDAANLAECVASPGYDLIRRRMIQQRQQYVDVLIAAGSWEETCALQGSIEAVDRSLGLPVIMQREMALKRRETNAT